MTNFKRSVLYIKYHNGPELIVREKPDSIIVCDGKHHHELSDHGRTPDGACCCISQIDIIPEDIWSAFEMGL